MESPAGLMRGLVMISPDKLCGGGGGRHGGGEGMLFEMAGMGKDQDKRPDKQMQE